MKVTANFDLTELVGPEVHKYHGDYAVNLLNPTAVKVLQLLRDKYGPCVVNNWSSGGPFKESGHRNMNTKTGAKNSMHKFGKAFDCKFSHMTPDEVRKDILKNQIYWLKEGLTRIEDGAYAPTWVHFDVKEIGLSHIQIIKP